MKKRRRKNRAFILFVILLAISLGYAILSTQLNILGTTSIGKNTWSVFWANIGDQSGVIPTSVPTISDEDETHPNTIVSFGITLAKVGDYYEFEVDAVNDGTLDAMLSTITTTVTSNGEPTTLPPYVTCNITYNDGVVPEAKHLLSKKIGNTPTKERFKIRVEYSRNITISQLEEIPNGGLSYNIELGLSYVQADNTAVARPKEYLKVIEGDNDDTLPAFYNTYGIKKNQVEKIYTMKTKELPSELQDDVVYSWDISAKNNSSIMVYALDTDSNSLYEFYLGATGGVKANPGSERLFNFYSNVTYIDVSNLITSDVEVMAIMFQRCEKLTKIDGLETWDTGRVTNMMGMFNLCSSLPSIDLSHFDTSNVANMYYMFGSCSSLTGLDLSHFDTSKVVNMSLMFTQCYSLTSLDLSSFNTSNVTNMASMFSGCSNLVSINLSSFNTNNVTNMYGMFNYCSALTSVNVSGFNTSNVTDMTGMFNHCSSLTSLDLSNFNTSKVTSMTYMFGECTKLASLNLTGFDTSNVTTMYCMFFQCSSLTSLDLSNFTNDKVTSMIGMFYDCTKLASLNLTNFKTSQVTSMYGMFSGCSSLTNLDLSSFNTSNVTDMEGMFNTCSSLTSLNLSGFNTAKVKSMAFMFYDCKKLTSINLSNFDMSNVTKAEAMFQSCAAAINIVLPNNYKRIDVFMFNHNTSYNQESFTIPKTVTTVGNSHIFYNFGTNNFTKFIVEEGSTTLKTIDDILYSYDGTKLISIPRGKTFTDDTYVMPDSVTTLNTMSFSRTQKINKVVISDNLVIDRYYDDTASGDSDPVKGNRLNTAIYVYTSVKEYEAKSTNDNYSSYSGCIYNKAGTELIAVPVKYTGVLNIKDGTTTIGQEAFWVQRITKITDITEINIPASVTTIEAKQLTALNKLVDAGTVINIDSNNASYQISNGKIVAK